MIAREWGGQLDPKIITGLARYTYLAQVTQGERTSKPFLVHGLTARDLHRDHHHPEQLPALQAAIGQRTSSQPITDALATHERHDQNIREAVEKKLRSAKARSEHDGGTGGVTLDLGPPLAEVDR